MKYDMRLNNEPFELIKSGSKTIEIRLNDEKRNLIKEKDIIIFENRITKEIIKTKVVKIHNYPSFEKLYKHFDKISLGYKENAIADSSDMEQYYSKEEQEKYGVLGIEIKLLNKDRKEIINNYDNLNVNEINRVVRCAKILIETNDNKFIVCHSDGNYHLLGGHVDNGESDMECLNREILEEAGVNLKLDDLNPFMTIKYLNKDYPEEGTNTFTMANYYTLIYDLKPNLDNTNLTDDEKEGDSKLEFIDKNIVLDILDNATRKGVTLDTISVIKEYLNK